MRNNKQAGFTLIELLIVIAIMAFVGTLGITAVMNRYDKARASGTVVQIQQLGTVLDSFKLDCGRYPTTEEGLEALVEKPPTLDCKNYDGEGYIAKGRQVPKDGFDKPFQYFSDNGTKYEIKSMGRDGKEGGDGFDADLSSNPTQQ